MRCPECGVDNADDHNYCKNCGFPLKPGALERELSVGLAEKSRDRYRLLIERDPENPVGHFNLGLAFKAEVSGLFLAISWAKLVHIWFCRQRDL